MPDRRIYDELNKRFDEALTKRIQELSELTEDEVDDLREAGQLTAEQYATWCKKYS